MKLLFDNYLDKTITDAVAKQVKVVDLPTLYWGAAHYCDVKENLKTSDIVKFVEGYLGVEHKIKIESVHELIKPPTENDKNNFIKDVKVTINRLTTGYLPSSVNKNASRLFPVATRNIIRSIYKINVLDRKGITAFVSKDRNGVVGLTYNPTFLMRATIEYAAKIRQGYSSIKDITESCIYYFIVHECAHIFLGHLSNDKSLYIGNLGKRFSNVTFDNIINKKISSVMSSSPTPDNGIDTSNSAMIYFAVNKITNMDEADVPTVSITLTNKEDIISQLCLFAKEMKLLNKIEWDLFRKVPEPKKEEPEPQPEPEKPEPTPEMPEVPKPEIPKDEPPPPDDELQGKNDPDTEVIPLKPDELDPLKDPNSDLDTIKDPNKIGDEPDELGEPDSTAEPNKPTDEPKDDAEEVPGVGNDTEKPEEPTDDTTPGGDNTIPGEEPTEPIPGDEGEPLPSGKSGEEIEKEIEEQIEKELKEHGAMKSSLDTDDEALTPEQKEEKSNSGALSGNVRNDASADGLDKDLARELTKMGGSKTETIPELSGLSQLTTSTSDGLIDFPSAFKKFTKLFINEKTKYKSDEPSRKVPGLWGREVDVESKGLTDLLFITDLSGSMDKKLLSKCVSEVSLMIYKYDKSISIDLVCFGTESRFYKKVSPKYNELLSIMNNAHVGGSTNFTKVIEIIDKEKIKFKGLILLTDFDFTVSRLNKLLLPNKKIPKLFIIVNSRSGVPRVIEKLDGANIKADRRLLITSREEEK